MEKDRKEFLGSSDIASVLGLSPYKSALQTWAEKTGKVKPKDLSENEAVEWGTRLERLVSKKFSEEHNVKLMAYKKRFQHKEYPFLSCELDNIIVGTDEIVEIKTCNAWAWKQWKDPDEMPLHYICQVIFALGLSGRKVGHVACLCGGQKYIEKRIEFDREFYDDMVDKAVAFWQMVQDKTPPMAIGMDTGFIVNLFPENNEQIQAIQEMEESIALIQQIKNDIGNLIKQKDELDAKLKMVIGDAQGIQTKKYVATWKTKTTKRIDSDLLKADGIYDKYTKETESRVLRIRKNKGGENGDN